MQLQRAVVERTSIRGLSNMTEQQQYHTDAHHPTGDQQSMITPPLSPSIVVDAKFHRTNMSAAPAESKKKDHSKFLIFLRLLMK